MSKHQSTISIQMLPLVAVTLVATVPQDLQ